MLDGQESTGSLNYSLSARDRIPTLNETRSRHYVPTPRSTPNSPRISGQHRDMSAESPSGRRRPIPDSNLPSRTPYRHSNLAYTTPRTYNSSPLVAHTVDMNDPSEILRAAEGTESTVSTTAPSTVWDELEELKGRIHRLELTGKVPTTSGGAVSRASNERPKTATTTVTTISSSPKRARGNSLSPTEPHNVQVPSDLHPLLQSALANSKSVLSPEVYSALEATTADALAIVEMMGPPGQPGPLSGTQSTIGGPAVSDRQVRRKTESICRNLTELFLALADTAQEGAQQTSTQVVVRPNSRDQETHTNSRQINGQRQTPVEDLARAKDSPRALSRLEARRSSLLAGSSLPSPRYTPSEVGTPTQPSAAGRRTSLLFRGRRAGTEELEDSEQTQFRAPSRATTEVGHLGRFRNSRELPIPQIPVQSALPVRRHYTSSSVGDSGVPSGPPVSLGNNRKFLDRTTPERDTSSVVGRLAEDRGQRKSSLALVRNNSLTKRNRQVNAADHGSTAG